MSKALLIDIGNSRLKWALCDHHLHHQSAADYDQAHPEQGFKQSWERLREPPTAIHACNVAAPGVAEALRAWCKERWGLPVGFAATERRSGGVVNGYRDPAKLGVDRWLAMIAAWRLAKDGLCVVDCGTAITVDIVNSSGRHQGGLILPGREGMQTTLRQYLPRLQDAKCLATGAGLGTDTRDAVRYGLYYAVYGALTRIADDVRARYGAQMHFYVCGGGAAQAVRCLRGCRQVPDLVLRGLAYYFSLI